jgi:acid phosphatase type 7
VFYAGGRGGHTTASAKRTAPTILMALVATLIAVGCGSEATPSSPEVPRSLVVVATGNIAADCRRTDNDEATAQLVKDSLGTVLALGDLAAPRGSAKSFQKCYEPSWGWFKWRTRPVPGNREYYTEGAAGYFDYFGEAAGDPDKGYYSFDEGSWHLVALNSNCEQIGGCGTSSPQLRWLKADLAANQDKRCTLAYMHHARFNPRVKPLWKALYEAGADIVLSANAHNYQRFAPQDPGGKEDPEGGIREFVVGTGGDKDLDPLADPRPNSEVHNDETYGVLKLTLHPEGYEWRFVPVEGETFSDSESARCH